MSFDFCAIFFGGDSFFSLSSEAFITAGAVVSPISEGTISCSDEICVSDIIYKIERLMRESSNCDGWISDGN